MPIRLLTLTWRYCSWPYSIGLTHSCWISHQTKTRKTRVVCHWSKRQLSCSHIAISGGPQCRTSNSYSGVWGRDVCYKQLQFTGLRTALNGTPQHQSQKYPCLQTLHLKLSTLFLVRLSNLLCCETMLTVYSVTQKLRAFKVSKYFTWTCGWWFTPLSVSIANSIPCTGQHISFVALVCSHRTKYSRLKMYHSIDGGCRALAGHS